MMTPQEVAEYLSERINTEGITVGPRDFFVTTADGEAVYYDGDGEDFWLVTVQPAVVITADPPE